MAWLERRGDHFRWKFRYGGQRYQHALKTADEREAQDCLARLEESLRLFVRGRLPPPPPGADLALYLLSDGKLNARPAAERSVSLGELFERYRRLPEGVKEPNTRYTERIHIAHLRRIIGDWLAAAGITAETLQRYADARSRESFRGKPGSHSTIRKEIGTFSSVWNRWAAPLGLVSGPAPTRGLIYRKVQGKPPFRMWKEIELEIARGGLTEQERKALWGSVFLTLDEVQGEDPSLTR